VTYEECMLEILANPEADDPRHELAKIVRPSDPDLSEFIETQLKMSRRMRETKYNPGVALVGFKSRAESNLLEKNSQRWSRNLDFYMGETIAHRHVEFYRGLPWLGSMNPYMFLEQGEYILTRVAPLRGVEFFLPYEDGAFPMKELAACPLLERLDEIRFPILPKSQTITPDDANTLAASPYLKRALALTLHNATLATYELLATNPQTQKCLTVSAPSIVTRDGGPIGECSARFDIYPTRHFEVSSEGHELEQKHGYLPWLHKNNVCPAYDSHYWVEQKVLPLCVPGSRVDAEIPYGSGLWPDDKRESRARFNAIDYDSVG
jgi:hypothetical protein